MVDDYDDWLIRQQKLKRTDNDQERHNDYESYINDHDYKSMTMNDQKGGLQPDRARRPLPLLVE